VLLAYLAGLYIPAIWGDSNMPRPCIPYPVVVASLGSHWHLHRQGWGADQAFGTFLHKRPPQMQHASWYSTYYYCSKQNSETKRCFTSVNKAWSSTKQKILNYITNNNVNFCTTQNKIISKLCFFFTLMLCRLCKR